MEETTRSPLRTTLEGVGLVVLALAGWTIAPLMIRHFTGAMDAWTQNGWRYGFAALLWLPYLLYRVSRGLPDGYWWRVAAVSAINLFAQTAFSRSFYHADPTVVTFGLRSQVIGVVVLAAVLFPAERRLLRDPWFLAGLGAVAGGSLITGAMRGGDAASGTGGSLGFWLAVVSGLGFAGYAIAIRALLRGIGTFVAFAGISQLTALGLVGMMLLLARDPATGLRDGGAAAIGLAQQSPGGFALFLGSAVAGIAIAHVLYYMAIRRLGVAVSTGIVQTQPFAVAIPSMLMFGERLSVWQWAGGAIAVLGAISIVVLQHRAASSDAGSGVEDLPADPDAAAFEAEADAPPGGSGSPA